MKRLGTRQRRVLRELLTNGGIWKYPSKGYTHQTWVVDGMSRSTMTDVLWALHQKGYVSYDFHNPGTWTIAAPGRIMAKIIGDTYQKTGY